MTTPAPAATLPIFLLTWIGCDLSWEHVRRTNMYHHKWYVQVRGLTVVARSEQAARESAANRVKQLEAESEEDRGVHWHEWLSKESVSCTVAAAESIYAKPRILAFELEPAKDAPYEHP